MAGQVIADNPFPKEAKVDPGHTVTDVPEGRAAGRGGEGAAGCDQGPRGGPGQGRHAYFLYPDGMGRSKLTITLIEGKLGTTGTARNWNTVLKLGALTEKS